MDTLRKALLFQVHPDYFHSIPAIKQQNEASLSVLLNLKLTRIESISVSFNAKNGKKVLLTHKQSTQQSQPHTIQQAQSCDWIPECAWRSLTTRHTAPSG